MSRCIRCKGPGTVVVHEIAAGSVVGPNPGPLNARVYACEPCTKQIESEHGPLLPWLNVGRQ